MAGRHLMGTEDLRISDEATGLPPLEEIGDDPVMVVLAWATGDGIVAGLYPDGAVAACRYLHVRGAILGPDGQPEWAQIHLAIPVDDALDLSVSIIAGTP